MGVIATAESKQQYIEVSPNAGSIDIYDANHQCTDSKPISARLREMLGKKNLDKAEQEKATFFGYRLATELKMKQTPNKPLEQIKKIIQFNALAIPRALAFSIILPAISKDKGDVTRILTSLIMVNLMDSQCKTFIGDLFNRRDKKQNEKELNKQTFYNLGLHTNEDYSHLFEKMNSPLFRKAFEEGRKNKIYFKKA